MFVYSHSFLGKAHLVLSSFLFIEDAIYFLVWFFPFFVFVFLLFEYT